MSGVENQALCPVGKCNGELYLSIISAVPIYSVNPPWSGAGAESFDAADAVTCSWEVVCTEGHTVWLHTDQIAADNASGLTDDDITGDYAPEFRTEPMFAAQGVTP